MPAPRSIMCRRRHAAATSASQMDGDDALVRRIVDAAAMPELLAREGATALLEACDAQAAVLFVQAAGGQIHVLSAAGCDAGRGARAGGGRASRHTAGPRRARAGTARPGARRAALRRALVVAPDRPSSTLQRFRTLCAVLRQGFDLCAGARSPARERVRCASSVRSSRCCPASSAPAPRCSASPSRFSGCRATT